MVDHTEPRRSRRDTLSKAEDGVLIVDEVNDKTESGRLGGGIRRFSWGSAGVRIPRVRSVTPKNAWTARTAMLAQARGDVISRTMSQTV